jgi:hypothetical protein
MEQCQLNYIRREAKFLTINLKDRLGQLNWTQGSYRAFAVLNLEDLDIPFNEDPKDYIFTKTDQEIKAVSSGLATGVLNVPLTEDDLDNETDFFICVKMDLGTYAKKKVIIKYKLDTNCGN